MAMVKLYCCSDSLTVADLKMGYTEQTSVWGRIQSTKMTQGTKIKAVQSRQTNLYIAVGFLKKEVWKGLHPKIHLQPVYW